MLNFFISIQYYKNSNFYFTFYNASIKQDFFKAKFTFGHSINLRESSLKVFKIMSHHTTTTGNFNKKTQCVSQFSAENYEAWGITFLKSQNRKKKPKQLLLHRAVYFKTDFYQLSGQKYFRFKSIINVKVMIWRINYRIYLN